ncbi:MAG: N-acetylmuramoyl-L-alanine amidase [Verrucomicrobiales bacterium]|nr:N-acetylmuramoyl-L-alanine amidase [Verrucomicrobiales bacterium]
MITRTRFLLAGIGLIILLGVLFDAIRGDNNLQIFSNIAAQWGLVEPNKEQDINKANSGKVIDTRPVVIIDPGHGGSDGGTVAGGALEKELNLQVGNLVGMKLTKAQVNVQFTRDSDLKVNLSERSNLANEYPGALFVSIHHNASTAPEAHGVEIYYAQSKPDSVMVSQRQYFKLGKNDSFSDDRGKLLAGHVQYLLCSMTGAKDRGIRDSRLAMTRWVSCPSILIECGFLSNAKECSNLISSAYREKMSAGIAGGVLKYLKMVDADPYYGTSIKASKSAQIAKLQSENSGS